MDTTYWAAELDLDTLVNSLTQRVNDYRRYLDSTGTSSTARRMWSSYYGQGVDNRTDSSSMSVAGSRGNLQRQTANIVAQIVDLSLNALLRNKPAYIAVAKNGDHESKFQAPLATQLIQDYDRRLALTDSKKRCIKTAWLTTLGWISLSWDESLGEWTAATENEIAKEGDIESAVHTVFDVAFDCGNQDLDKQPWVIIRTRVNKWDLAARYPNSAQYILNAQPYDSATEQQYSFDQISSTTITDYVWLYEFRHIPTAGLPNGRLVKYVNNKIILDVAGEDGQPKYPYGKLLLCYPATPDKKIGVSSGHSPVRDLLGLQQGFDMALSAIATTVNAHGVQNWWTPPGSGINPRSMAGGLNWIQSPTKPEVLAGAVVQSSVTNYLTAMQELMRQRFAINDVVAGDASKNIPAQAIAALQAQFYEFHSGSQSGYTNLDQNVTTGILFLLKEFAKSKRVAMLAGHQHSYQYQLFSSEDISAIDRIVVEPIGAATQTQAGRTDLAEKLYDRKEIDGPQFLDVINTGQMNFTNNENQDYTLKLDQDKDMLRQGIGLAPMDPEMPRDEFGNPNYIAGAPGLRPLATDDFVRDIKAYRGVLFAPEARSNPRITNAVLEVIEECKRLHRQTDPYFSAILGVMPPPPPMAPEMMSPAGMAENNANSMPQQNGQQRSRPMDDAQRNVTPNMPEGAGDITLPRPPENPLTGERPNSPFGQ